mgnify:CR=1 FL=1
MENSSRGCKAFLLLVIIAEAFVVVTVLAREVCKQCYIEFQGCYSLLLYRMTRHLCNKIFTAFAKHFAECGVKYFGWRRGVAVISALKLLAADGYRVCQPAF